MAQTHRKIRNVYALTPAKAKGMRNAVIGVTVALAGITSVLATQGSGGASFAAAEAGLVMPGEALMRERLRPEAEKPGLRERAQRFRETSEARLRALFSEREEGLFDKPQDGKGEDYAEAHGANGGETEEAVDTEALKQALADLQPLLEQLGQGQGFAGSPEEAGYKVGVPMGPLGGTVVAAVLPTRPAGGGGSFLPPGGGSGGGGGGGGGSLPGPGPNGFKSPLPDVPADPVPVPGAAVLLVSGLAAFGWKKRRAG
ncbi:hypothetical protein [Parvularcula maris]|uniref:Uncharacterized protein n=1 Tax=Parvularcula maris TaxID=2965077 RepID=A0A9X2LAD6_9PROT|nr:hypothetical protein [Parvularcula maris]MCQ8184942.1 hypothetical protein [Parvularcula maris]